MLSAQEERRKIVQRNVPRLIQLLTGFQENDPNFSRCKTFALNLIENHRNLDVNSHNVRRQYDGIIERFRVENLNKHADYLERLYHHLVQHPVCLNHYEFDIHWSLLDFLLSLAQNPIKILKSDPEKVNVNAPIPTDDSPSEDNGEFDSLKSSLRDDFIPLVKYSDSDELSDWSDEEEGQASIAGKVDENSNLKETSLSTIGNSFERSSGGDEIKLKPFKPPMKESPFTYYDNNRPAEKLQNCVQHSWWMSGSDSFCQAMIESELMAANFADLYHQYIHVECNNIGGYVAATTITEPHLMRELIWMFHMPQRCTMFNLDNENHLRMRHFTVPSVTANGLKYYLEKQFFPYIEMMNHLRCFHNDVYNSCDKLPPKTIECYASQLHLLLSPVWDQLLLVEDEYKAIMPFSVNTIIQLRSKLKEAFQHLHNLYDLHRVVMLNWREQPAHICSAYLLACLMHNYKISCDITKANLAASLLLGSIKAFCEILDTWWLEGRLDDWRREFIVERTKETNTAVCVREYKKNREKAFYVHSNVSNIILNNSLFLLLREHSMEVGRTLHLLYQINRIGDMRNEFFGVDGNLYEIFIDTFLQEVRKFQNCIETTNNTSNDDGAKQTEEEKEAPLVEEDEKSITSTLKDSIYSDESSFSPTKREDALDFLTTNDDFLLLAFYLNTSPTREETPNVNHKQAANLDNPQRVHSRSNTMLNAMDIFQELEKNSTCILPLEEIMLECLEKILRNRISLANSFVIQLYRKEFGLLKHLQYIRKVLLLEESDLMHQFYTKVFHQIENNTSWANAPLLTMHLDDIISSRYPEVSSLFQIQINSRVLSRSSKVLDGVEALVINYNLSQELLEIITNEDIYAYNKVFRFLLKVKWGVTTLEKLSFSRTYKRRNTITELELIDIIMRRLEQMRFWMIFSIQNFHTHLMTYVLQSMGERLDEKMRQCENLKEMEIVHKSYLSTVCEHCFLTDDLSTIKIGIEQLLNLVAVFRLEWESCIKYIEYRDPLALCTDESELSYEDYLDNNQMDGIEAAYIQCHEYLANMLNHEVYLNQRTFLSGLSAAFNTSLPT